jgi:hypothetical protein
MAKLTIHSQLEFRDAMSAIPFARKWMEPLQRLNLLQEIGQPTAPYGLWHELLDCVREAMDASDWPALRSLLAIYDAVERAGERSEMYESSYVAFLEDLPLPKDPAQLREFWRHCPPLLMAELKRDRGIR